MKKILFVVFTMILSFIMVACTDTEVIDFNFETSEVTIKVGETYTMLYELTEGFELEYTLSEEGIISIDGDTVTALAVGEVDVTATVVGSNITDTFKVIVEEAVEPIIDVDSVLITGANTGVLGSQINLTATVLPVDATNKVVSWVSSDVTLATVSNGVVTLLKAGVVTITATADEVSDTHEITITEAVIDVESVEITGSALGTVGDEITLSTTVLPVDATNKAVSWTSSDETLATVSNGVVTLLKAGFVTITATADGVSDTHEITITELVIDVESVEITGPFEGTVGDEITLSANVLPV